MRVRAVITIVAVGAALVGCSGGNVFELATGDCFGAPDAEAPSEPVSDVEVIDCDEAHASEVFAVVNLDDGDYPGDTAVQRQGEDGCVEAFEGYVGTTYARSSLQARTLLPSAESWAEGDRAVVCFLQDGAGDALEGSMADSGA